jgi:hypothetical protein
MQEYTLTDSQRLRLHALRLQQADEVACEHMPGGKADRRVDCVGCRLPHCPLLRVSGLKTLLGDTARRHARQGP